MLKANSGSAPHDASYTLVQHDSPKPDWGSEVWGDDADDDDDDGGDAKIDDDSDTSTSDAEPNFDENNPDDPYADEAWSGLNTRRDALLHDGFQVEEFRIRDSRALPPRYEPQSDPKSTRPLRFQQPTPIDPKALMSNQQSELDSTSASQKSHSKQRNFRRLNPAAPKPQYGQQLTRNYQLTRNGDNPRRMAQWDPLLGRFIIGHRRRSVSSSDQDEYPNRKYRVARSIFGGFQQKPEPALDPQPASPPRPGRQLARKGQLTRTGDSPRNYQEIDQYGRFKQKYRRRSALFSDQNLEPIDSYYMRRHEELRQPVITTPSKAPHDITPIRSGSVEKHQAIPKGLRPRHAPLNDEDLLKNHPSHSSPPIKQDQGRSREQSIQTVPEWTLRPSKAQDNIMDPWNLIIFSPDGFKHPEFFLNPKSTSHKTDAAHKGHGTQADLKEASIPKTEGTKEQATQTDPEKVLRPAKLKTRIRPLKANYEDHPADELAKTPLHGIPEDQPVTQFPTPRATPELMRYRRIKNIKAFSEKMRQRWKSAIEKGGLPGQLIHAKNIQQYQILPESPTDTIRKDLKISLEEPHSPPSSPRKTAPTSPLSPLFPSQSPTPSKAIAAPQNTKDFLKGSLAPPPPLPTQTLRQPQIFRNSILAWKRKRNGKRS